MLRDRRVDRRIERPIASADPIGQTALVSFRDGWGTAAQTFDPATLDLPVDLVPPLMAVLRIHDAGSTPRTRAARWRALQRFSGFLVSEGVTCAREINAGTMQRYLAFLARPAGGKRLKRPTMGVQFALIRPLLERAEQADPVLFGSPLAMPYNPVPGSRIHEPKSRLPKADLQAILAVCYEEIDAVWKKFQYGQSVIAATDPPHRATRGESLESGIWRLHRLTGGLAPTLAQIDEASVPSSTLFRWGSRGRIADYFHLTTKSIVPFYIAIAIQLAANPDPLRVIRRDCLVPHPIDENRVLVEWLKHKTGPNPKLQRRSFDRRRPHSAPRLIEMVLAMTEPLRNYAPVGERDSLFLTYFLTDSRHREHDMAAGLIPYSTLAQRIDWFIDRANDQISRWNSDHPDRQRWPLPRFTAGQLRGSVATQHYVASGGDLLATAAILNHRDPVVTDAYVEGPAARKLERETIARLQKLMLSWVTTPVSSPVPAPASANGPVTALFGHRCMMPTERDGTGNERVCAHLGGCLTCPGLIVPLDAEHYARVLQAQRHLETARDQIDPERWRLFYAPSLRAIEQDLLPAFPESLLGEASALAEKLPILPDVE